MVMFSYGLAYVLSMLIEAPSFGLEKVLFRLPNRDLKDKEEEKIVPLTVRTEKTKL